MRLRADAARNSEKVLEAAREVFAEQGLTAGIDDVAARAGVGKATVYRCWPTKDALVAAVTGVRVDWFTDLVVDALDDPDPWAAFERLLLTAAESSARNRLLNAGLTQGVETPELAAKRAACRAAVQRLVDRAVDQGTMRRDVTSADVTVLFNGLTASLADEPDPLVWRRYAGLVVAAFRS
jgi:AcrR family transcriptional regulator